MISKLDLLLHPVRMRIVMALAGRALSPGQIAKLIPDVAQTSLYRQINTLVEGGILMVAAETQVRGTVEKTYTLLEGAARLETQDLEHVTADDQMQYFMIFLSSLIHDFANYLAHDPNAPHTQHGYSKAPLYLTSEELGAVVNQFQRLIEQYSSNTASDGRKRYIVSGIFIPEEDSVE